MHALSCLLLVCRVWAVARRVRSALGEALLAHTVAIIHRWVLLQVLAYKVLYGFLRMELDLVYSKLCTSGEAVASNGRVDGTRHGPDQSMRLLYLARPESETGAICQF